MKTPVLIITVLGCVYAVPNGYYHQEYNYKSSSSSFKNNELQHKTDDQGYYKKDGDLEGRYKPRIDSNNEHSEYVNPNLKNAQYDRNLDTNSYGNMRYDSNYGSGTYGMNSNHLSEDLARSDRIIGSQAGYYGGQSNNRYIGSSSQYGVSSNLRAITSRLQQECEDDLQDIVRANAMYGGSSSRLDIAELEQQLKNNLTQRLNQEIARMYGTQVIRDGKAYSLSGGRLQAAANYDNQEYMDLKNQIENSLLNKLRTEYHQYSSSQYYDNKNVYVTSTTRRPVINYYPEYTTTVRPVNYQSSYRPIYPQINTNTDYYGSQQEYHSSSQSHRYTPVANPESLTQLASKVQSQLDSNLNSILDETRRMHFADSQSASLVNKDVLLDRLRNELRTNISYHLDEVIRQNYGDQRVKDGYMYSVGPRGDLSQDYNYGVRDLESLRQQIERNLVDKLNRDFEQVSRSWSSSSSYSSQSSYGSNSNYEYGGNTGIKTGAKYIGEANGNMAELQRKMQDELSRQLNLAVSDNSYGYSGYTPQNYQELRDELNRNLTRHIQEYSASGSYAAYGNFDRAQMADLKARLQENLTQQLQQAVKTSTQSHSAAYSASSSSGSYGASRGYDYRSKRETSWDMETAERGY